MAGALAYSAIGLLTPQHKAVSRLNALSASTNLHTYADLAIFLAISRARRPENWPKTSQKPHLLNA